MKEEERRRSEAPREERHVMLGDGERKMTGRKTERGVIRIHVGS